jgi:hypothetical protein
VIRCNATNSCDQINFENVNITGWWEIMEWNYITEYAYGSVVNSYPKPSLGQNSKRVFYLFSLENTLLFAK